MAAFLDACRFNPTAGGTTDWTYSSAVTGYQSPSAAGVVNARVYKYRAESADLTQWEIGEGAYTTGTSVLARTTVLFNSAGTTAKINFSAAPQVAVVALKEDLLSVEEANSFTAAQKDQAGKNLGLVRAIRVQKFTASGTYTPDANLLYAIIECQGAGGGGGGSAGTAAQVFSGAGGGGGGYSRKLASAASIGASQSVTIGAAGAAGAAGANTGGTGGATSVGALCVANGGLGGTGGSGAVGPSAVGGGAAGTGDVTGTGQPGQSGFYNTVNGGILVGMGGGGSSQFGGGGIPTSPFGTNAGSAASGFGGGGSGGVTNNTASTVAGGAGSPGLVIITEYCSA